MFAPDWEHGLKLWGTYPPLEIPRGKPRSLGQVVLALKVCELL